MSAHQMWSDSTTIVDVHCARCAGKVKTDIVFQDGMFFHQRCLQEGFRTLANAERIARALNPALFIHDQLQPE